METKNEGEVSVIENVGIEVFEAQERAAIDIQVATAKRYPRNLRRVLDNSLVIATMNKETAKTCRYAKPVGGKSITGPSVHLARIICQQYGNIRIQQRIKSIDQRSIVAEAVAFDMETNYAVCVEARRSIIDKNGNRYAESVIETNAMAILAIAERNAILKVIPKSVIDRVYDEAFKFAYGDLSDSAKLLKERERVFREFKNIYAQNEDVVIKFVGVNTKEAISAENIADLIGMLQSLKDKEITIEDLIVKNAPKKDIKDKKDNLAGKAPEMI
jgi:hypothetical protein